MPEQSEPLDPETLRWKVDKDLELYRFYLDIAVKVAVFLMTVTGATASYVLANDRPHVSRWALAFPALMNGGFAMLFYYSIEQADILFRVQKEECSRLGVAAFNMRPLVAMCQLFCGMCVIAVIVLLLLIPFGPS